MQHHRQHQQSRHSSVIADLQEPLEAKVVLLGSSGVGKTSLLARCQSELSGQLAEGQASCQPAVSSTIGPVFSSLVLRPPAADGDTGGPMARLQVWDTAGAERFRSLAPLYYRSAAAALLVFDLSDRSSYADLSYWTGELAKHQSVERSARPHLFLVANKCDLQPPSLKVSKPQARQFADSVGAAFHATSAVTGAGVLALFNSVASALLASAAAADAAVASAKPSLTGSSQAAAAAGAATTATRRRHSIAFAGSASVATDGASDVGGGGGRCAC